MLNLMFNYVFHFTWYEQLKQTPVAHLTFAGLSIAAQTEAGAAAAGPRLVSVPQETDVRAAASFSKLIQLTSVATH